MAMDHETEPSLKRAFKDLRELKVDVAFPLLLELYDLYQQGLLSVEEKAGGSDFGKLHLEEWSARFRQIR